MNVCTCAVFCRLISSLSPRIIPIDITGFLVLFYDGSCRLKFSLYVHTFSRRNNRALSGRPVDIVGRTLKNKDMVIVSEQVCTS
jgi:hypothetical protein